MINRSATLSGGCYLDTQHQGLASELRALDEIKITWFLDRCLVESHIVWWVKQWDHLLVVKNIICIYICFFV